MVTSHILDDPQTYTELDPSGLGGRIAELPNQCRQAWEAAQSFALPKEYAQVDRVVLLGMGGSAIGGDLLAGLAALETAPPITVVRDYLLPPYVDSRTLVIASSYSGNTEETLLTFERALEQGARVVAITYGGQLARRCRDSDTPAFHVDYQGEPRSALGYSFIAPLALLCNLGLLSPQARALNEALGLLEHEGVLYGMATPVEENPAKTLAQKLHGRLIVVYGTGILTAVARRWTTQFNENAKAWAFYDSLPELNHNTVVGYQHPRVVTEGTFIVLLQPSILHPRTGLRYQITAQILEEAGIPHHIIAAEGHSPLAQVLSTLSLGDYTSYYLAFLNGVDPSPVPIIDRLKQRLAEG